MNPSDTVQAIIWEDGDATCMARVLYRGATTSFLQSAVTSITRKIFDKDGATPDTAASTTTLTIASTVFDTLQTDGRWSEDGTGYNFRDVIAATNFPSPHTYRIEYYVVTTGGSKFFIVFELHAQAVGSS